MQQAEVAVSRTARGSWLAQPLSIKVPQITAVFWLIKLLTTGMGETASDTLVHRFGGPVAVAIGFFPFVVALVVQFRIRRYNAWTYWIAVAMVAVFGTMAADILHVGFGIPYVVSASFYGVVLALVFLTWSRTEHTLSIHGITTRRRETFYWLAVLSTFALGTACGDITAVTLKWGYFDSSLLFAALIALPAMVFWVWRQHAVFFFWCAYVLTRPLGASVGDWLGRSHRRGGLALGTGLVTGVAALIFVVVVAWVAAKERRDNALVPVTEEH